MCWLAVAVRTLQKRVEVLEAATNDAKCKNDDLHGFKQILSDDQCVPRQKTVHEMDFFDVTAYNQVETVPLRHVSFAETVKMVEFDRAVHTLRQSLRLNTTLQHQLWRNRYMRYLILWKSTTTGQSSRSCMFHRYRSWRRQLRFRSCRLSRKSLILQKSRLFNALRVWILLQISKWSLQSEPFALPLADCEGAIEELSKAMAEGFSAVLDEFIENFDKPEGLSAVIDEHFEKFDEPDKNLWSDEYVCGTWASEKGESNIFMDSITNRLSFEEVVDDSEYLHGWLNRHGDGWQARLISYDTDEEPWYSHSGGEEPEYVGGTYMFVCCRKRRSRRQIKFSE